MKKNFTDEEYGKYVRQKSPKSKAVKDTCLAFLIGGAVCALAQFISWSLKKYGVGEETAKKALPVIMIFLGALLTGLNLYGKIGKVAGAGTIIPVTGFANSIVSSAMEFKSEGWVLGLAVKMFSVAGPVIVYGTVSAVFVGVLYLLLSV